MLYKKQKPMHATMYIPPPLTQDTEVMNADKFCALIRKDQPLSRVELMDCIYEYLKSDKDNWHDHSFKSILSSKLTEIFNVDIKSCVTHARHIDDAEQKSHEYAACMMR
jgi:hypothetical protein